MSDTTWLRMPKHEPEDGTGCSTDRVLGYAHMNPDGTLMCNRCGWVTPKPVVTTYSPDTGRSYLTFDDLVGAEGNGWAVVSTIDKDNTVPMVNGPYETRSDARRAQARLRRKFRRQVNEEYGPGKYKVSTYIRPIWKENR